ncbi:hypothetical protein B296_00002580 [Ensete ventricosum]|uniref:Uncharacterized protein n=1 Tax=Ensete ventricosum TaxID=4639 RepID=A0A427B2U7_ENSVE|nr:hypothetical protein B296_00002580 [Ensete ventricosum]
MPPSLFLLPRSLLTRIPFLPLSSRARALTMPVTRRPSRSLASEARSPDSELDPGDESFTESLKCELVVEPNTLLTEEAKCEKKFSVVPYPGTECPGRVSDREKRAQLTKKRVKRIVEVDEKRAKEEVADRKLNVKVSDLIDIEDFVYDKVNLSANSSAVQRLSEKGLLDADAIVRTDEATMASLIYPVYP